MKAIIQFKELNHRPDWEEISHLNSDFKIYLFHWDSLELKDNILYRRWEFSNRTKFVHQIIVPKILTAEILESSHNFSSSGHFGIDKTQLARLM